MLSICWKRWSAIDCQHHQQADLVDQSMPIDQSWHINSCLCLIWSCVFACICPSRSSRFSMCRNSVCSSKNIPTICRHPYHDMLTTLGLYVARKFRVDMTRHVGDMSLTQHLAWLLQLCKLLLRPPDVLSWGRLQRWPNGQGFRLTQHIRCRRLLAIGCCPSPLCPARRYHCRSLRQQRHCAHPCALPAAVQRPALCCWSRQWPWPHWCSLLLRAAASPTFSDSHGLHITTMNVPPFSVSSSLACAVFLACNDALSAARVTMCTMTGLPPPPEPPRMTR